MGGEETKLISVIGAAAELSISEVTDEEAAEGGQVAAPGVANVLDSVKGKLAGLVFQGADMGWKLGSPPVKGISE